MRVISHTTAFSALLSGDQGIAGILREAEAVLLSPIAIGELLDGFMGGTREAESRAALRRFRDKPRSTGAPISPGTSEFFASKKRHPEKKGVPSP